MSKYVRQEPVHRDKMREPRVEQELENVESKKAAHSKVTRIVPVDAQYIRTFIYLTKWL